MDKEIRVPGYGKVTITENLADRVINYLDPVKGLKRLHSRVQMSVGGAYFGASKKRRGVSQWMTGLGSANADIIPDLPTLRERSRDLVRNEPIAGGAINTACTNVVGPGITAHPSIDRDFLGLSDDDADKLEAAIEREYRLWSESVECDVTRTQTFVGLQDLAFRSSLENGDALALLPSFKRNNFPYGLKVQLIEADRVCNKDNVVDTETMAGGVVMDEYGAPVQYHILKQHPGGLQRAVTREWETIDAFGSKTGRRNILHLFTKIRIGQTRGVPYLAPVIEPLKQLGRYTEAEIMAAVISGMFTVFVKSETDSELDVTGTNFETGAKSTDDDLKMGNGAIVGLGKDEDVSFADPSRPNTAFDPFVQAILRQVGVRLELPFEVLIKHFTASYSAARAALMEAWRFYISRRRWLVQSFCQPVYEEFIAEAVAIGRLNLPGFFEDPLIRKAYCSVTWIGPGKGQINEKNEMDAVEIKIDRGILTYQQATAEINGGDWSKNARQLKRERSMISIPETSTAAAMPQQQLPEPADSPDEGIDKS